jgi:hypothetical protein
MIEITGILEQHQSTFPVDILNSKKETLETIYITGAILPVKESVIAYHGIERSNAEYLLYTYSNIIFEVQRTRVRHNGKSYLVRGILDARLSNIFGYTLKLERVDNTSVSSNFSIE